MDRSIEKIHKLEQKLNESKKSKALSSQIQFNTNKIQQKKDNNIQKYKIQRTYLYDLKEERRESEQDERASDRDK
jgi:hypothetical protein